MKFAVAALLLLAPALAFAQATISDYSGAGAPPFSLALSPTYPPPYGKATLSITSTVLDLANATLSVSVNGSSAYKGSVQPVSLTIGGAGVTTTIRATIVSAGQSYTQSLSLIPGDVALIQEPVASAPPLYPGKPLLPTSGQVRLVAIAGFRTSAGAAIDPSALSYSWSQDGTVLGASGIGKDAIVVNAPLQYRASTVSVTVSTQGGSQTGEADVSLAPEDPTVRIYANDPLLGIRFDHALAGSYAIKDTEASFYAAPYSFSTSNGAPTINWFLNGSAAGSDPTITLRPTGSGAGGGSLSVTASESGLYESAAANLSLSFGDINPSNLFGL